MIMIYGCEAWTLNVGMTQNSSVEQRTMGKFMLIIKNEHQNIRLDWISNQDRYYQDCKKIK